MNDPIKRLSDAFRREGLGRESARTDPTLAGIVWRIIALAAIVASPVIVAFVIPPRPVERHTKSQLVDVYMEDNKFYYCQH